MEIDFTKYFPLVGAILSATLGYMFGARTKKNERLIQFTQENLKEVFSPLYHEMKKILSVSVKPRERELLLDALFVKYLSIDTTIYKLGNLKLLDTFYELSDSYEKFKKNREEEQWKLFWYDFECILFYKVKEGYSNSTDLLYRDYNWQQYIQTKAYWKKFFYESMRFLYETAKGLNVVSLLLVYFSGCFKLIGLELFPKDFWVFSLMILGLSVMATTFLLLFNIQYITLSSNSKHSFIRQVMNKLFPNILVKWDGIFNGKRNFDRVPKMYDKRLFGDD